MTGGEFTISTGDDGFHSDGELTISDGTVQIDSSYEGIEGMQITISGGEITVKASDDGLNSAGGSDEMSAAPQDRFWDQGKFGLLDSNHRRNVAGGRRWGWTGFQWRLIC